MGYLLALHGTPANEQDRTQVAAVQAATGETAPLAFVDQGSTDARPRQAAAKHRIALEEATRGFVLLPRR